MNISQKRRNIQLKKKIKFELVLTIVGLAIFFLSMLGFVIDALTIKNVTLAWILFAFIIVGSVIIMWGLILFLYKNKEKIKKYLDEIIK